jgi:hypothetical protein
VSGTVCGLPFALSVMETVLAKSPSVEGANVTLIVHGDMPGRELPEPAVLHNLFLSS